MNTNIVKVVICLAMMLLVSPSAFAGLGKCAICGASTHSTAKCPRSHAMDKKQNGYITQNGRNAGWDRKTGADNVIESRSASGTSSVSNNETHNVAGEGNYAQELAAYRAKQAEQARLKAQSASTQQNDQRVVKLTEEKSALETKLAEMVLQNQKLQKQAEYYEKYARTLHNQLINNPAAFKTCPAE